MCVCLYAENRFSSREHTVPFLFFYFFLFFCRFSQKTHALSHVHVTLSEFSFVFFSLRFAVGCLNLFSLRSLFFFGLPTTLQHTEPKRTRKKIAFQKSWSPQALTYDEFYDESSRESWVRSREGGGGTRVLFYVVYSEKIIRITTEKHSDDSSEKKECVVYYNRNCVRGCSERKVCNLLVRCSIPGSSEQSSASKKSKIFTRAAHLDHHFRVAPKALREIHLTISHNEQKQPCRLILKLSHARSYCSSRRERVLTAQQKSQSETPKKCDPAGCQWQTFDVVPRVWLARAR